MHTDICYVLAFSCIMLNTSLHNPNVQFKPTLQQFIAMNSENDSEQQLPELVFQQIYARYRSTLTLSTCSSQNRNIVSLKHQGYRQVVKHFCFGIILWRGEFRPYNSLSCYLPFPLIFLHFAVYPKCHFALLTMTLVLGWHFSIQNGKDGLRRKVCRRLKGHQTAHAASAAGLKMSQWAGVVGGWPLLVIISIQKKKGE